jgi:hypothetical protein
VFHSALPDWKRIFIANDTGVGHAPWCEQIRPHLKPAWVLHMGPIGFADCSSRASLPKGFGRVDATFIHELVHVWQGQHGVFAGGYMLESLVSQALGVSYHAKPGKSFIEYTVEQQAEFVEKWYERGMPLTGPLWPYIRDNIRRGNMGYTFGPLDALADY